MMRVYNILMFMLHSIRYRLERVHIHFPLVQEGVWNSNISQIYPLNRKVHLRLVHLLLVLFTKVNYLIRRGNCRIHQHYMPSEIIISTKHLSQLRIDLRLNAWMLTVNGAFVQLLSKIQHCFKLKELICTIHVRMTKSFLLIDKRQPD